MATRVRLVDRVADGLAHLPHLAVAPFPDRDDADGRRRPRSPHVGRPGLAPVDDHALARAGRDRGRRARRARAPRTPAPRRGADGSGARQGRRRWSASAAPLIQNRAGRPDRRTRARRAAGRSPSAGARDRIAWRRSRAACSGADSGGAGGNLDAASVDADVVGAPDRPWCRARGRSSPFTVTRPSSISCSAGAARRDAGLRQNLL